MSEGSLRSLVGQTSARKVLHLEPKREEDVEYEAFSFGRVGQRPQIMLEICKSDGFRLTIPYIDLKSISTMNPDLGFELKFGEQRVLIEGRNLIHCYRYIKQNRLESIVELGREGAMNLAETDPVVCGIKLFRTTKSTNIRDIDTQ